MKKNNYIIYLIIFIFGILTVTHVISIPCPIHYFTNLYCPGCGVSRMILSLLKLDIYQAFRYNQLLFLLFPFFIFFFINDIYSKLKKKESLYKKVPEVIWYVLIIILIIYAIIRNINPYFAPTKI